MSVNESVDPLPSPTCFPVLRTNCDQRAMAILFFRAEGHAPPSCDDSREILRAIEHLVGDEFLFVQTIEKHSTKYRAGEHPLGVRPNPLCLGKNLRRNPPHREFRHFVCHFLSHTSLKHDVASRCERPSLALLGYIILIYSNTSIPLYK